MTSHPSPIDPSFAALGYRTVADAALQRAFDFGVDHADFRFERIRSQDLSVRDGALQGAEDGEEIGFAVRVIHQGAWGFASSAVLTVAEGVRVAEQAVRVAQVAAPMTRRPVTLAPEPTYPDVTWAEPVGINPLDVELAERAGVFQGWTAQLCGHPGVDHASGHLLAVQENKFYADIHGTSTTQQRIRMHAAVEAHGENNRRGIFESMRTIAPPVGRGWEWIADGSGLDDEVAGLPDLLAEKLAAPSVEAGHYDLVIHPSNLWLTIHESIGHATELDRALGYEANYAGTSFATPDHLDTLRYGSSLMNVTGDRTVPHGLATIGYDDEGVQTQAWDIIRDGVLVGYQLDRSMASNAPTSSLHTQPTGGFNGGRSNGCAYADSPGHIPIQRMANVSLQPDPDGPDTAGLIRDVEDGIYIVGDRSWSIDMQRYNFQFTGQQFHRIKDGELTGQLRDVAYQATTTDFWGAMDAVGGPGTWVLGGAFNCGKAQPGQVAAVSHGCPTARFRGIRVLNTAQEGASA